MHKMALTMLPVQLGAERTNSILTILYVMYSFEQVIEAT